MGLEHKAKILTTSCRALGLWPTARAILVQLLQYKPEKDRAFDRRFKTDTSSIVGHEDLDIADPEVKKGATFYVSVPARFERYILAELGIDYKNWDFVDIGSGKGRILMLASDFPFRSITGLEISRRLCDVAVRNLQIYRSRRQKCSAINVQCVDAREARVPCENTIFHLYHPFETDILTPVLSNIRAAFEGTGKQAIVVYIWTHVPSLFGLFESQGFTKVKYEQTASSRWQYAAFATGQRGSKVPA